MAITSLRGITGFVSTPACKTARPRLSRRLKPQNSPNTPLGFSVTTARPKDKSKKLQMPYEKTFLLPFNALLNRLTKPCHEVPSSTFTLPHKPLRRQAT